MCSVQLVFLAVGQPEFTALVLQMHYKPGVAAIMAHYFHSLRRQPCKLQVAVPLFLHLLESKMIPHEVGAELSQLLCCSPITRAECL